MESIHARTRVTVALLTLIAVVGVVAAWSTWDLHEFVVDIVEGGTPDEALGERIDERQAAIGGVQTLLLLGCGIAFPMWMHRAYKMLVAARLPGLRYTPAWAAGGFFVPLLNLVRPCMVMRELWSGSTYLAGDAPAGTESWSAVRPSMRVTLWWILFVAMGILGNISGKMMLGAKQPDEIASAVHVTLFSDLLDLPTAIVAIGLVRTIGARLERARERFAAFEAEEQSAGRLPPPLPVD